MTALTWDGTGEKQYETGVDHGVLYLLNTETAEYDSGFAWNGLTAVNEKPDGAAPNRTYADNILYANLLSAETFGGTIEAYTFPDEFATADGSALGGGFAGVVVGQQPRKTFGLCYRTKVGTDVDADAGFKLHLVYGALAVPSEKDYTTLNDSPEMVQFSWDFNCTPVTVTDMEPTCLIVVDSTVVSSDALSDLTDMLYGTSGTDPSLPLPDDVIALFSGSVTAVTLSPATFNGAHAVTIPSQTGVRYRVDGVIHSSGTVTLTTGQTVIVTAETLPGYVFNTPVDTDWMFTYVS